MKHTFLLVVLLFFTLSVYCQDTLCVYFIYGSKPKTAEETSWFGGKLGGHVGLGIHPDTVYHFNPGGKVRAFGKKGETGRWFLSTKDEFLCTFGCDSDKVLMVYIPVDHATISAVRESGNQFVINPTYPYAFFGMRCTAACYHLLSIGGITQPRSNRAMIRKNFYPRKLRKRLLKLATQNGWKTVLIEGRDTRKWDHD